MNLAWRLCLLLAAMRAIALVDRMRHGPRATKWREYGFLLASGLLGGVFGIGVDQITSRISPDYFIVGKGIAADGNFRLNIVTLGFQAGLAAGFLVGGCFMIANNPRSDLESLSYGSLFEIGVRPIVWAMVVAPFLSLIIKAWDPLDIRGELADLLSPAQRNAFLTVWGIHLGLYVGGVIGTIQGVLAIRSRRLKKTSD